MERGSVSNAANLGNLKGRMAPGPFFRNGWDSTLLTERVLEMITGATAPACCHDGTRVTRPLGFPWTDR